MKSLFVAILAAVFLLLDAAAQTGSGASRRVTVSIDASKTGAPISPFLYGQFIEHIGDLVNRSVWAEMLDDRKFYNPITSNPGEQRPVRGRRANRWMPIGPDSSVTADGDRPWVGDHSPRLALAGSESRGIRQSGLALRKGKAYTGRVVLSGTPGAKVAVSLAWGSGPGERQSLPLKAVNAGYTTYPLKFVAEGNTDDGRIEIAGTGQGAFHIGAVSLMPADNIRGFRPETVALLKEQHSGMYRFPGGNFLSNHDWHDAIGDPDKRPPTWDYVWSAVQPNDVGTDEFLTLCQLLGVDAFSSVNAGFGEARSAAQEVEYVNGSADTPMGKLRAANGHPAPYNVKWWGIGNEMYGSWQFGQMALSQYDLIKMAGHTMGTASIEFNATEAALNTTGLLFKLYRDHFGTVAVPVDGNSPVPVPLYPVGGDQPKVNAGSPTYPVDVSAALTTDGKFLTVAVVNPTESAQTLDLGVKGIVLREKGRMWRMTGPNLTAATGLNSHDVQVAESLVDRAPNTLEIAPISITIYEFGRP